MYYIYSIWWLNGLNRIIISRFIMLQWAPGVVARDQWGDRPPDPGGPGEGTGRSGDQDGGQESADLQDPTPPKQGTSHTKLLQKPALAKIFIREKWCMKVKKRFWFVIRYVHVILKQTQLILKTLPLECSWNWLSIYVCFQANRNVHWVKCWRFNIYGEFWTILIMCSRWKKNSRKHVYIF